MVLFIYFSNEYEIKPFPAQSADPSLREVQEKTLPYPKPTLVCWLRIPRRRANHLEGTRQNDSVTLGEGVRYFVAQNREIRLFR